MRSTMIISRGATRYTLNYAQYGYSTEIRMALAIGERRGGLSGRPVHDNTAAFDQRIFHGRLQYPPAMQGKLNDFFRLDSYGRGHDFQIETGPGFYPFGPDLSSVNRFPCKLVEFGPGPVADKPWLWSESVLRLSLLRPMAGLLPQEVRDSDGALSIGPVDGLRFPPSFYASSSGYGVVHVPLEGGSVECVDRGINSDWWETQIDVSSGLSLGARLVDYLTRTARGDAFTMKCGPNSYPFGLDLCDSDGSGHYRIQLIDPTVEVMHMYHDVFVTRIKAMCRKFDRRSSSSSISTSQFSSSQSSSSASGSKSKSSSSVSKSFSSVSLSSPSLSQSSMSSPSESSSSHSSSLWAYF